MSSIALRGVSVAFGPVTALDRVDLDVTRGDLLCVLGPSGCGKTTLLRVIAGFVTPDAGTLHIDGRPMFAPGVHVPPERRGIGVVPQDGALFAHLSVADNIGFGLPRRTPDRDARIGHLLELVGLGGLGDRRPHELSGGQQQRVALARALAPKPRLVLLDEPFSALDAGLRAAVRADVRSALRAESTTALLVTHDQDEALSMADVVAVMRDGRIAEHGTAESVYRRPRELSTARFVGELVELPGVAEPETSSARTALGSLPVLLPATVPSGGRVRVCLRPEQFRLTDGAAFGVEDRAADGAGHNGVDGLPGVVTQAWYHGPVTALAVDVSGDGAVVSVRARSDRMWPVGSPVRVVVCGRALAYALTPAEGISAPPPVASGSRPTRP